MPFVALGVESQQRLDITAFKSPRHEITEPCMCPYCNGRMFIVAGKIRVHYFRHQTTCTTEYEHNPESPDHLLAKQRLKTYLAEKHPEYKGVRLEFEYLVKEAGRIADLMAIFPSGWRVAHEIQLSSITTEWLEKRTEAYFKTGIDVWWWLGKHANTETNYRWCRDNLGYALSITFAENKAEIDIE
jgi:competence CoiA-like predicted nuclease